MDSQLLNNDISRKSLQQRRGHYFVKLTYYNVSVSLYRGSPIDRSCVETVAMFLLLSSVVYYTEACTIN
jgi:hypothetical protein